MKKQIYFSILLSLIGLVLSIILLLKHIFPLSANDFVACGSGVIDTCQAVSQSHWGTLFKVPLATYGIIFYAFILLNLFILLASKTMRVFIIAVLLPLEVLAIFIDIFLGYILLTGHSICTLCVATYGVNLLLLITLLLIIRNNYNLKAIYSRLFSLGGGVFPKAFPRLFLYAIISLTLMASMILLSFKLENHAKIATPPDEQTKDQLKAFYEEPPIKYKFPKTELKLGSTTAPVKIHIFMDFLCSACRDLFKKEKLLLSKYNGKIEIKYYHYPLDSKCNEFIEESVYENSCIASYYMEYAGALNIFEQYLNRHFEQYDEIAHGYDREIAESILIEFTSRKPSNSQKEIQNRIKQHIDFAEKKLLIEATPTIIIKGRKITGNPPLQLMERIVERELDKIKK